MTLTSKDINRAGEMYERLRELGGLHDKASRALDFNISGRAEEDGTMYKHLGIFADEPGMIIRGAIIGELQKQGEALIAELRALGCEADFPPIVDKKKKK